VSKLIYSAITSLDGYVSDESGDFDWAAPDADVHTFVNGLERPVGTYLYGRRMYETMVYWETADDSNQSPVEQTFTELWRAADKIVYSRSLEAASSVRTRVERVFDPRAVRRMKAESASDITVGGPELAAHALRAGLVDECRVFVVPVVIGGGNSFLPGALRLELELLDERPFRNGTVYLNYAIKA
jgi:dihydrofolate reductase